MEKLPVSTLYILLHTLLVISQAYWVVIQRRKQGVGLGHGDRKPLQMAMASHANAIENIPLALLILLVAELNGGNVVLLYIAGGILFVARILHALGTSSRPAQSFGRYWGTLGTWLVMLGLAGYTMVLAYL
jgi:uncharacterized membrane protein YecN with MAPEG domain